MKKITWLFLSLMLVLGMGTAFADGDEGENPTTSEIIAAPTFSPVAGVVPAGTQVTISGEVEGYPTSYKIAYVIDDENFDFTQYMGSNDVPYGKMYTDPITINTNKTITAAIYKYDEDNEEVLGWSEKVSATYIIKADDPDDPTPGNDIPAPVFNPDGGSIQAGDKILLTNGTENDATPKPIYYNFKGKDVAETAFKSLTTKADLDKEMANPTVSLRKANTYEATGIELTADKTISAATADIDAAGNVTWSTIVTRSFTIGAAPTPGEKPAAPTFTPDGGAVEVDEKITIETTTPGAKIYYIAGATAGFTSLTTNDDLEAAVNETVPKAIDYSAGEPTLSDFQKETPGDKCSISAAAVLVAADGTLTWSDATTKEFTVKASDEPAPAVEIPVITPGNDAAVHIGDMVTIECATDEAKIYYTTDGTAPFTMDKDGYPVSVKEGALEYTEPFALTEEMLIKQNQVWALKIRAVAAKGDAISPIGASAGYVVYPNAPTFDPVAGAVKEGTKVTVSCIPTVADIYYTIDGTTPTMESSAKYTEPIEVTAAMTIKAIAVLGQYQTAGSASYTLQSGDEPAAAHFTITPAPTAALEAGTKINVTYSDATLLVLHQWFADIATAEAAEFNAETAGAWYEVTPDFLPELTAAKPVLKVLAIDDDTEEVKADSIVVYTVKDVPAPQPTPIAVTFNPASGSTVAPGTKISVEIAEQPGEGEELNYQWFESKEEAEAAEWAMDWGFDEPEAKLEAGVDRDTLYLKVALVEVNQETFEGTAKGYSEVATYIVDRALENKLVIVPNGTEPVKENDEVTITVTFGGEEIEGTIVYKWYATMDEANADETLLTTAAEYVATAKPVITKAKPVLTVGYKNAEGWVILPETIEYTFGEVANEAGELAGVNVYPNPNDGTFNVAVPERACIDIFGLNGAMLMSREVNAGVEAFQLDHSGIYFIRVMAGNKTAVKRVVVR